MLHIRRLQGLDSHVHVNKAIGFLNTPKLSFPCCRNPPLWLVWSQLNKCAFPGPKTVVAEKKLIVDDLHSFPNQTVAEHRKVSICWQGFLYKIALVLHAVRVAKFHRSDDSHLRAKPITGIKISIGKLEFKWAFLSPPPLSLVWVFLLFVLKGLCFLWTDSFELGHVTVLMWMGGFVPWSSLLR